jgi:hypothetical protein
VTLSASATFRTVGTSKPIKLTAEVKLGSDSASAGKVTFMSSERSWRRFL